MVAAKHYSVLLKESVEALVTDPDGVYVDGTFGRGGHSREILSRLTSHGKLIAFDKDPEAIAVGQALAREDERFTVLHSSFLQMNIALNKKNIFAVDGITMDLGVSSPQLDCAERGFSFLKDGPLDMRMDNSGGNTAEQWLKNADEKDIAHVLKTYGEERYSKRIARAIVEKRLSMQIDTTLKLAEIVSAANPKWEKGKHPATRAFQAIRIFINRELDDLTDTLDVAVDLLKSGGRMVVISFHSLEDRIVKRFLRDKTRGKDIPLSVPVTDNMLNREMKIIGKALKASDYELEENIRSRSAVMRAAEKL